MLWLCQHIKRQVKSLPTTSQNLRNIFIFVRETLQYMKKFLRLICVITSFSKPTLKTLQLIGCASSFLGRQTILYPRRLGFFIPGLYTNCSSIYKIVFFFTQLFKTTSIFFCVFLFNYTYKKLLFQCLDATNNPLLFFLLWYFHRFELCFCFYYFLKVLGVGF